nr:transcriptional regulator [Rhizobium sp. Q54]
MDQSLNGTDFDAEELASGSVLHGLGERIRAIRLQQNMTLQDLSTRCQVSVAMLSHIERGRSTPSIKVLDRIRLGLGVPFGAFFEEKEVLKPESDADVIMRREQRPVLRFDAIGLKKELLSPVRGTQLEMMELRLQPNGHSGEEPWRRVGEKCGVVLAGSFSLTIGSTSYELREGDAFQFDSSTPHSFQNTFDSESRIMWIILSREFG